MLAELKLLGAQRIKALTAMLKDKEQEEIKSINSERMKLEDAEAIVNAEIGIAEYIEEVNQIRKRLKELSELISPHTGVGYNVANSYSHTDARTKYQKRVAEVQFGDINERIKKTQNEYKEKQQRLWLCETLEEAKELVGIS